MADLCFVIMGYGVKTDPLTGRDLDLDKTYHNLIKPSVESCGLRCIRADEVRHSGVIDKPMYDLLIHADIVIADLSTYNPNAFYELGVRHALRPYTTIAISESDMKPPFDVNHTVIRKYEHLGKDIGYTETMRFRKELETAIQEILKHPEVDSPVYTFLPWLQAPTLPQPSGAAPVVGSGTVVAELGRATAVAAATPIVAVAQAIPAKDTLSTIVGKAKAAIDADKFIDAIPLLELAREIDPTNSYIVQKLALATYKSKRPSHIEALQNALNILDSVSPDCSTDPETLGLAGAIHKRLWEERQDPEDLAASISFYEKGFKIKSDYYNGINLAFLLNVRATETGGDEAIADKILAKRVRQQVVGICNELTKNNFDDRGDRYWILATLEEAYFGLGDIENYQEAKERAITASEVSWERSSTEEQIAKLAALLAA